MFKKLTTPASSSSTTTTTPAASSTHGTTATPKRHSLTKPDAGEKAAPKPGIRKPRKKSHHFPSTVARQVAKKAVVVSGMRTEASDLLAKNGEEVILTLYKMSLNSARNNRRKMPNLNDLKCACNALNIHYNFDALSASRAVVSSE